MPLYTFHPRRPDDASDTFVALDLGGDHEVEAVARELLQRHPSCNRVEVWQEDREVTEVHRPAMSAA